MQRLTRFIVLLLAAICLMPGLYRRFLPTIHDSNIERWSSLDSLLDKVATYKEKTEALKRKIKKAMTYPSAVILVAILFAALAADRRWPFALLALVLLALLVLVVPVSALSMNFQN